MGFTSWLAPEHAPKPPSKNDSHPLIPEHATPSVMPSIASKFDKMISGAFGSGADTSKDGNKDAGKDTNKDAGKDANKDASKDASKDTSTNKDGNKDTNTTKAGAVTTESGANRGTLENINTSVSAQNNDLLDLQKGGESNGKQSPTPKSAGWKKGGGKK